jgi:hypothetical protein
MGKGKGKSRAVTMDGVIDSLESVGTSSMRVQWKQHRKLLPDETEHEHQIKYDEDDDNGHDQGATRTIHTRMQHLCLHFFIDTCRDKCLCTTMTMTLGMMFRHCGFGRGAKPKAVL